MARSETLTKIIEDVNAQQSKEKIIVEPKFPVAEESKDVAEESKDVAEESKDVAEVASNTEAKSSKYVVAATTALYFAAQETCAYAARAMYLDSFTQGALRVIASEVSSKVGCGFIGKAAGELAALSSYSEVYSFASTKLTNIGYSIPGACISAYQVVKAGEVRDVISSTAGTVAGYVGAGMGNVVNTSIASAAALVSGPMATPVYYTSLEVLRRCGVGQRIGQEGARWVTTTAVNAVLHPVETANAVVNTAKNVANAACGVVNGSVSIKEGCVNTGYSAASYASSVFSSAFSYTSSFVSHVASYTSTTTPTKAV